MSQIIKIKSVEYLTHDVIQIIAQKPEELNYKPGQAVDISINKPSWEQTLSPFTFTSLPENKFIEFTIKTYPAHHRVTEQLLLLGINDELIIHDPFGDIGYKGEGVFIAGGAGITPFIAIFKQLEKENKVGNNKLIFANKTKEDIIQKETFEKLLGNNFINILSGEKLEGYEYGHINEELIQKEIFDANNYFYLCGPEPMMEEIERQLNSLKISADRIVKEGY